ncbi:MAG: helix-turn-helix domain-containing protein [Thermodesulfobacteriota bacterium]|nr:helix-turn-helix domain-containing protein [Thermodesulfobacteriota bacterium]
MKIKTLKEREKEHLEDVLEKTGWDMEKTARLLQISLSEVKQKISEHGLGKPVAI